MATPKFNRWDNALKKCMDAKPKGAKGATDRWNSDPLVLNQEAHELPPDKQKQALDFAEEAAADIRATLAPMWKYCFVQWHIYDASLEATEQNLPLLDALDDDALRQDLEALKSVFESGALEQAKTAEEWTWDLLAPLPPAGTIDPWNDATAAPVLKVGRAERRKGVRAFEEAKYTEAFAHCLQGLKLVARAPPTVTGPQAKLRCDLYKNKAAVALKLKMHRTALKAANYALAIDGADPKAWYRKSNALEALGRHEEARSAKARSGLDASVKEEPGVKVAITDNQRGSADLEHELGAFVEELEPRFHKRFEQLVFAEVGIDSIAAVDLLMYLKSELQEVPLLSTLVFDFPTVERAVDMLLQRIQAENDAVTRAKMNNAVWRAMCRALGTDPVKGVIEGRLGHVTWPEYSVEAASAALRELKAVYEEAGFVKEVRNLAKQVAFEQRAFLVRLRPLALEAQKPVLEARGFDPDLEGLQQLECAIVSAAMKSPSLRELLKEVRIAQQGGPNGMWTVNMEQDEVETTWADCNSVQCWSQFMKADPFGAERKNTNSVLSVA